MTIGAPFTRIFRPPFGPNLQVGGGAWWNLFGAIPLANCVAAYQPKGAANLAASYSNLVTPGTYDAAPGTAPTWDAVNGWIFNGTTNNRYLKTGIIPVLTGLGWSAIVKFTNVSGSTNNYIFGSSTVATTPDCYFFIISRPATPLIYFGNGHSDAVSAATSVTTGTLGIADNAAYVNGISIGGGFNNGGTPALEIYIGARNFEGTPAGYLTGYIQALAIYNSNQSANMAALNTAIAAL